MESAGSLDAPARILIKSRNAACHAVFCHQNVHQEWFADTRVFQRPKRKGHRYTNGGTIAFLVWHFGVVIVTDEQL